MKHLCIYHKNCSDGFGAALAVNQKMDEVGVPESLREFFPAQYGDSKENYPTVKGKNVIIVDFSYPRETLIRMYREAASLVVIDHHKTAQEALEGLNFCHFDMTQSGAMLTWKHLFPDSDKYPVPKLIEYIQGRDIWTKKLPHCDQVAAALQSLPKSFKSWRPFLNDELIIDLIDTGSAILLYQQRQIEKIIVSGLSYVTICGHCVPCINTTTLISEIGNEISKGSPFAVMYFDIDDKRIYSLRSASDGIDVSEIAKKFGGGGHFHAAGFSIDEYEMLVNRYTRKPKYKDANYFDIEINRSAGEVFSGTGLAKDEFNCDTIITTKQSFYSGQLT